MKIFRFYTNTLVWNTNKYLVDLGYRKAFEEFFFEIWSIFGIIQWNMNNVYLTKILNIYNVVFCNVNLGLVNLCGWVRMTMKFKLRQEYFTLNTSWTLNLTNIKTIPELEWYNFELCHISAFVVSFKEHFFNK